MEYQEIKELQSLNHSCKIRISPIPNTFLNGDKTWPGVIVELDSRKETLYLFDEYNDLSPTNYLLNLHLFLLAMEDYEESSDYLSWCQEYGVNPSNSEFRNYHIDLAPLFPILKENLGGVIQSPISKMDWQLNAGAAEVLRDHKS